MNLKLFLAFTITVSYTQISYPMCQVLKKIVYAEMLVWSGNEKITFKTFNDTNNYNNTDNNLDHYYYYPFSSFPLITCRKIYQRNADEIREANNYYVRPFPTLLVIGSLTCAGLGYKWWRSKTNH